MEWPVVMFIAQDRTGTVFVGSLWQSIRWQRAYFDKAYANGNLQRRYLCPVLLHVMSNDYRHWSFHKLMSHAPFHGLGPRGEAFAHLAKCYSTLQTLFVIISLFNVGCNCKPANWSKYISDLLLHALHKAHVLRDSSVPSLHCREESRGTRETLWSFLVYFLHLPRLKFGPPVLSHQSCVSLFF
jgi:hypothetical protein